MHTSTKAWAVLAVLFFAASASMGADAPVPDWVRQAANQTLPAYPPDTNAVVLLDNTEDSFSGPGDYVEHTRRVVKILRKEGRDQGRLYVGLQQQEKLIAVHAWSIDKDGHTYELKDKEFIDRSPYDDSLYSDYHARIGDVPAPNPGSVVAIEYTVHRHEWLNQLHWFFQQDLPFREEHLTLRLPPGWEYKTTWANSKPIAETQDSDGAHWVLHDVPAIEEEERMPEPESLAGRAEIAYFAPGGTAVASWDGLGNWYDGLIAGRRNPSPELEAKARELTAGHTDFDGKVRTLATFLQTDVRYVGIEIGIGGFQPHAATEIFHARYGDCKDKATLLSSMLKVVGIDSDYILIDTDRGIVKADVPSALFNHAILAIELPADVKPDAYESVWVSKSGKRYLIFDPTDEYTPLGSLRGALQDTNALLVTDHGGELITTPLLPPESNVLSQEGHFTLSADGALSGEVTETLSGDHAHHTRLVLSEIDEHERTQRIERQLGESLQGFTLQNSAFQQLDQRQKDLIMNLKLSVPQYGQVRGPLMLVRPRVLGEKAFDVDHRKPRLYSVTFHAPSREVDTYEIEIPKEFTVDDVPDPVKLDAGFASYQSKIEVIGSKIRYTREYVVHALSVDPAHFADLRQFEGRIGAEENSVVVLKRTAGN